MWYFQVYESHWVKAVGGLSQDEMISTTSAPAMVLITLTQFETASYRANGRELLCFLPR